MLIDVLEVHPLADFQLDLVYANGERRRFDMKGLLSVKPWQSLRDPQVFQQARAEYGTVVWPGEIDIAPETLYDDSIVIEQNSPR